MLYTIVIESEIKNPSYFSNVKIGNSSYSIYQGKDGDCIEMNTELIILLKECRGVLQKLFERYENEDIDDLMDQINNLFFLENIEDKNLEYSCDCGWFGTSEDLDENRTCPRCDEDVKSR